MSIKRYGEKGRTAGSAELFAAGLEFATRWTEAFPGFVKASMAQADTTSVRTGLANLGNLFVATTKRSPMRDLVKSKISAALAQAIVPAKLHGVAIGIACRRGLLTAQQASKRVGVSTGSLRKLEGRSDTFLAGHDVKGGAALYDEGAISRLASILRSAKRPIACSKALGIPRYCMNAFASAGLIEFVTKPDAIIVSNSPLITNASVDVLCHKMDRLCSARHGSVTLQEAMKRVGDPRNWVAVFNAILSEKIGVGSTGALGTSLVDTVLVDAEDLVPHISDWPAGPEIDGI